jgi:VanZ family protein
MLCWNGAVVDTVGGQLLFPSQGMARTSVPDTFNRNFADSGMLSVEMWLTSNDAAQLGPARILTYSAGPYLRNLTIGQAAESLVLRLRRDAADPNGRAGELILPGVFAPNQPVHVLVRHDSSGTSIEIDGVLRLLSADRPADFSSWNANFDLVLGNEATGDRPWLGAIDRITIRSGPDAPPLADFDFTGQAAMTPGVLTAADLALPRRYLGFAASALIHDEAFTMVDFLLHVGMLVPVGFLSVLLLARQKPALGHVAAVMLFVALYALAVEIAQGFTITRTPSILDWASGLAGGGIGIAAALFAAARAGRHGA